MNNYLALTISVVVALLTTSGAAAALHHVGRDLRDKKNHRRQLDTKQLSVSSAMAIAVVSLLITTIAGVAFQRVWREGRLSGLDDLALLLAALVALVMLISSGLVYWSAFRDGSPMRDDLGYHSNIAIRYHRKQLRYQKRERKAQRELDALVGTPDSLSSNTPHGGGGQILRLPDAHEG